jgi:hypothetical protein
MRGGLFVVLLMLVIGIILISTGLRGRSAQLIKALQA